MSVSIQAICQHFSACSHMMMLMIIMGPIPNEEAANMAADATG